jgi:acyl-CoA synthetase (AMP-forming)/AMP-acid ligase II
VKALSAVLAVAIALMLAGAVSAQVNPPQKEENVPERTNPAEVKAITEAQKIVPDIPAPNAESATKIKMKKLSGTVVGIDAVANTLTVKVKKHQVTFVVDPNAPIMWGGNTVKLIDVPKQGKVFVNYVMDGKARIATAIMGQPLPANSTVPPKSEAPKAPASPNPANQ